MPNDFADALGAKVFEVEAVADATDDDVADFLGEDEKVPTDALGVSDDFKELDGDPDGLAVLDVEREDRADGVSDADEEDDPEALLGFDVEGDTEELRLARLTDGALVWDEKRDKVDDFVAFADAFSLRDTREEGESYEADEERDLSAVALRVIVPVGVTDCVEERELNEDNVGVLDDLIEAVTEALPDKSADVDTLPLIVAISVAGEF